MNRQITLVLILLVGSSWLYCQQSGSFVTLDGGAGINNLNFKIAGGETSTNMGTTFNLGYNYFFTPQLGFHTGLGIKSFNNTCRLNHIDSLPSVDIEGKTFLLRTQYTNWTENQTVTMLDVPIAMLFRLGLGPKAGFRASLGVRVLTPISASYQTTAGSITTVGYYGIYNVPLHDIPSHGFLTIKDPQKGDISNISTAISGFAEAGFTVKLMDKVELYLGGYFDYGLLNAIQPGNKPLYEYSGTYNGIFASDKLKEAKPMAFGGKIGVVYDLSPKVYTREELQVMRARQMQRMQQDKERQKEIRSKEAQRNQMERDKIKADRARQAEKQRAQHAKSKR
jgi:hypothetical protein